MSISFLQSEESGLFYMSRATLMSSETVKGSLMLGGRLDFETINIHTILLCALVSTINDKTYIFIIL